MVTLYLVLVRFFALVPTGDRPSSSICITMMMMMMMYDAAVKNQKSFLPIEKKDERPVIHVMENPAPKPKFIYPTIRAVVGENRTNACCCFVLFSVLTGPSYVPKK
jgi:hypothetical protein